MNITNKNKILLAIRNGISKEEIIKKYDIPEPILDEWIEEDIVNELENSGNINVLDDKPDVELSDALKIAAKKLSLTLGNIDTLDEPSSRAFKNMADAISSLYSTFCKSSDVSEPDKSLLIFLNNIKE